MLYFISCVIGIILFAMIFTPFHISVKGEADEIDVVSYVVILWGWGIFRIKINDKRRIEFFLFGHRVFKRYSSSDKYRKKKSKPEEKNSLT